MSDLGLVLRKSRLLQIVFFLVVVSIVGTSAYAFIGVRVLSALALIVLACTTAFLALRVVQLEWRAATSEKSARSRQLQLDINLELVAETLRNEFAGRTPEGRALGRVQTSGIKKYPEAQRTNALVIGRGAAHVPESTERQSVLYGLLHDAEPNKNRTRICGVFSQELKRMLAAYYEIVEFSPSTAREQASDLRSAIVVIDERAFENGPWFGADSAGGTALFSELNAAIDLAIEKGSSVWYVATGAASKPYTNAYKKLATGVVGYNSSDTHWAENMRVAFIDAVDGYVLGLGKIHE